MHCFSYGPEEMREALELGFFISFACNITFKNAVALLDVAKSVPLDRLVLETDSPYLAPQAHRGSRNEPAHLAHLADFLATQRNIDAAALRSATSANAVSLFKLESQ
jgi:TatD DNase family protein